MAKRHSFVTNAWLITLVRSIIPTVSNVLHAVSALTLCSGVHLVKSFSEIFMRTRRASRTFSACRNDTMLENAVATVAFLISLSWKNITITVIKTSIVEKIVESVPMSNGYLPFSLDTIDHVHDAIIHFFDLAKPDTCSSSYLHSSQVKFTLQPSKWLTATYPFLRLAHPTRTENCIMTFVGNFGKYFPDWRYSDK